MQKANRTELAISKTVTNNQQNMITQIIFNLN